MKAVEKIRRPFGQDSRTDGEKSGVGLLPSSEFRQRERRGDAVDIRISVPGHKNCFRLFFIHKNLFLKYPAPCRTLMSFASR